MQQHHPTPAPRRRLAIALAEPWLNEFIGDEQLAALRDLYDAHFVQPPSAAFRDVWHRQLLDARPDAILTGWGTPVIPAEAVPPLAVVAHTAGSIRGLVTRAMIERGLLVTNWGPAAGASVAEHALLLVLAGLRRLTHWTQMLHAERGWPTGTDHGTLGLYGRRVGLHGFGSVAQQFVRLVAPFGCRVRAYSAGVPEAVFAAHGVERAASLDALFAESDVLVEVEALNAVTRGSVTEALLRALPPRAVFVNVGRGSVVDGRALERVAADGNLQIALDVFDPEPLAAASPLRGLSNVTLTPHVAGPTHDQRRACGERAVATLLAFARGQGVQGAITADEFDRMT